MSELTKDFKETVKERLQRDPAFKLEVILESFEMFIKIDDKLDQILDVLRGFNLTPKPTTMPLWAVGFMLEPPCDSVEMEVQAPTSKDAVWEAMNRIKLKEGEMFHSIHVGPPRYLNETDGLDET